MKAIAKYLLLEGTSFTQFLNDGKCCQKLHNTGERYEANCLTQKVLVAWACKSLPRKMLKVIINTSERNCHYETWLRATDVCQLLLHVIISKLFRND